MTEWGEIVKMCKRFNGSDPSHTFLTMKVDILKFERSDSHQITRGLEERLMLKCSNGIDRKQKTGTDTEKEVIFTFRWLSCSV